MPAGKARAYRPEAEFHRAAFGDSGAGERRFPWGAGSSAKHGNFNFHQWAPTPVGSHPSGGSVWGVQDLIGDGWEWTDTIFEGLPSFEPYIPGYPGYSADFFDGNHYVLKGASWATGGRPRAPELPQLVPGPLPLRLRQVPLRGRRLKKAHLLRWRPRQQAQRRATTPRVLPSGAASQLDLFEHPAASDLPLRPTEKPAG